MEVFRDPSPAYLTIEETARYLRLSRAKTYRLAAAGDLPSFKIGKSVRISRAKLTEWMDAHSRG